MVRLICPCFIGEFHHFLLFFLCYCCCVALDDEILSLANFSSLLEARGTRIINTMANLDNFMIVKWFKGDKINGTTFHTTRTFLKILSKVVYPLQKVLSLILIVLFHFPDMDCTIDTGD